VPPLCLDYNSLLLSRCFGEAGRLTRPDTCHWRTEMYLIPSRRDMGVFRKGAWYYKIGILCCANKAESRPKRVTQLAPPDIFKEHIFSIPSNFCCTMDLISETESPPKSSNTTTRRRGIALKAVIMESQSNFWAWDLLNCNIRNRSVSTVPLAWTFCKAQVTHRELGEPKRTLVITNSLRRVKCSSGRRVIGPKNLSILEILYRNLWEYTCHQVLGHCLGMRTTKALS
jgi:hypothetical protein